MRLILFMITTSMLSGCFVVGTPLGQVVRQRVTCTSDDECKMRLAESCPSGAMLHDIRQAVEIEFSCKF